MIGIIANSSQIGMVVLTDAPGALATEHEAGGHAAARTYGVVASDTLNIEPFDTSGNWVWEDGIWLEWEDGEVIESE